MLLGDDAQFIGTSAGLLSGYCPFGTSYSEFGETGKVLEIV